MLKVPAETRKAIQTYRTAKMWYNRSWSKQLPECRSDNSKCLSSNMPKVVEYRHNGFGFYVMEFCCPLNAEHFVKTILTAYLEWEQSGSSVRTFRVIDERYRSILSDQILNRMFRVQDFTHSILRGINPNIMDTSGLKYGGRIILHPEIFWNWVDLNYVDLGEPRSYLCLHAWEDPIFGNPLMSIVLKRAALARRENVWTY